MKILGHGLAVLAHTATVDPCLPVIIWGVLLCAGQPVSGKADRQRAARALGVPLSVISSNLWEGFYSE